MKNQDINRTGNAIYITRKSKCISLKQLESMTNIKYQILSRYEKGIEIPTSYNLQRIEEALQIQLSASTVIDDTIYQLYNDFLLDVFMGETDLSKYEQQILKNKDNFITSKYFYLVQLMTYVIYVHEKEISSASKMEKNLERIICYDQKAGYLYWEYKGLKYYKRNMYEKANEYFDDAAKLIYDEYSLAINYYHKFFVYKHKNMLFDAKHVIETAKSIFEKYGAIKRSYSCNMCLADVYTKSRKYEQSNKQYEICLSMAKTMNYNNTYLAKLYRNMAWNCIKGKDYHNAIEKLEQAQKCEKYNPLMILYYIYVYYELEDYKEAQFWVSEGRMEMKTREYRDLLDLFSKLVRNQRNVPNDELIQKAIEVYEYFMKLKDYDLSEFYVDIVIELLELKGDWERANVYLKQKNNYAYL